jgi:3-oxoacyl-[acyl-carrier-protein] synthase II
LDGPHGLSSTVLVTGVGVVGGHGGGIDGLRLALESGVPPLSEVDRSAGYHRDGGARLASLTPPGCLKEWLSPNEGRRMSPPSKLAVAASRMALRQAGLGAEPEGLSTGVVIATAFGPSSYSEALVKQILFEGPEAASPFYFTESVANAPAAQIAIACRARGPSVTVCQREAGPLLAVGQAAAAVASGRVRRALAGSVDEMSPLLHALLDRFGALATPGEQQAEVARPFDRRRDGFLAGEGAGVLLLESEESAAERGVRPLARVLAWGSAFDPTAPPTGWGNGHAELARALRRGLTRAGVDPAEIDRVVSGGSGSRGGDRLEARLLRSLWGEAALPPVLAPKAVTGEYGGAHLGAAVLAVLGAPFGPVAGFREPDPELGVVPHDGAPLPPPARVLVTSVAAGGAAAWLVLEGT